MSAQGFSQLYGKNARGVPSVTPSFQEASLPPTKIEQKLIQAIRELRQLTQQQTSKINNLEAHTKRLELENRTLKSHLQNSKLK